MSQNSLEQKLQAVGNAVQMLRNSQIGPYAFPVVRHEFTNWRDEQRSWRETCALFDQSHHMTDLYLEGPGALQLLSDVGVNSVKTFKVDQAKQIVIYREAKAREQAMAKGARITLDQLHEHLKEGETKELNIILKADVGGSAEVLADMLQRLSNDKVRIRVLHTGVGAITENDVMLALTSNAIIIGFNVRPERQASAVAEREKVDIRLHTIGETSALGICGSGLIDLLAGLLDAGVIDPTGLIQVEHREALPHALRDRVVMRGEERQVIVARPGEHGASRELVLTQDDVRQVQLAKGAIASGIAMLQHVAGVPDDRVEELMLAGGFGNYLSIGSAIRIGLIPALPPARIRYVGNAASLGAQLCLLSEEERARAERVAARIDHVSLAAHPDFESIFVDAMNFPRGR